MVNCVALLHQTLMMVCIYFYSYVCCTVAQETNKVQYSMFILLHAWDSWNAISMLCSVDYINIDQCRVVYKHLCLWMRRLTSVTTHVELSVVIVSGYESKFYQCLLLEVTFFWSSYCISTCISECLSYVTAWLPVLIICCCMLCLAIPYRYLSKYDFESGKPSYCGKQYPNNCLKAQI